LALSRQLYQENDPVISMALNPDPGAVIREDLAFLSADGTLKFWKAFGNEVKKKAIYDTAKAVGIAKNTNLSGVWELGLPNFKQVHTSIR
jgi:hypothetical protein